MGQVKEEGQMGTVRPAFSKTTKAVEKEKSGSQMA
jgi:hypothetical protein